MATLIILLWRPDALAQNENGERVCEGAVVVIDHNLALDMKFSADEFCKGHVFADDLTDMFSDFLLRQTYEQKLQLALATWDSAWNNVPPSWSFIDEEQTVASNYPQAEVKALLRLVESPSFWNLPA